MLVFCIISGCFSDPQMSRCDYFKLCLVFLFSSMFRYVYLYISTSKCVRAWGVFVFRFSDSVLLQMWKAAVCFLQLLATRPTTSTGGMCGSPKYYLGTEELESTTLFHLHLLHLSAVFVNMSIVSTTEWPWEISISNSSIIAVSFKPIPTSINRPQHVNHSTNPLRFLID